MIGELIKIFRKARGVGVMELSKKLGINRISLFRIEKGQRQPSEKTAIEALKFLGLSEEHIYAIFVFNEMLRWKMISRDTKQDEVRPFLKRLNTKDQNGRILSRYFERILNQKRHAAKRNRT